MDGYKRVKRVIDWEKVRKETNDLVLAKITGAKSFQEGKHTRGYASGLGFESEPSYFTFERTVVVWALRLGYRNKEKYFFEEDIKPITRRPTEFLEDIPYLYSGWTKEYRKKLSRESKDWPRNDQGQWSR
jgi:hypothetical protein